MSFDASSGAGWFAPPFKPILCNPAALSRTAVLAAAWGLLAVLLLFGGARHEPWFDEAQAWLIARDASPWKIVAHVARYEGTPALWHLLIWGLQRLGLAYAQLYLVSSACALTGAALVLFRSPFPIWIRMGIVFSYFFAYQYAVVARSYALDLLFVPLIATMYRSRHERPLIYGLVLGLTANANAHSFVLCIPLALEQAWSVLKGRRSPQSLSGPIVYAVLALAAAAQAWPPHDPDFNSAGGIQLMGARPVIILLEGLIDRSDIFSDPGPGLHIFLSGVILSLLVIVTTALLAKAARTATVPAAMFGGTFLFMLLVYSNYWHSGIFFLILVFTLWTCWCGLSRMSQSGQRWLRLGLGALLGVQVVCTGAAWSRDWTSDYSAARALAPVLERLQSDQPSLQIAAAGFKTFAVQPYLRSQPFANYEPGPAYYNWSLKSGVALWPSLGGWATLARSRRYDRLLLSTDNSTHDFVLAPFVAEAARDGYCVQRVFPGALIWKTRVVEPDAEVLFGRCSVQPPPSIRPRT